MIRALKHGLAGLGLLLAASGPSLAADGHDMLFGSLLVDQLEHGWRDGHDTVEWKAQGWVGGDVEKLYLKTEGEYVRDDTVERFRPVRAVRAEPRCGLVLEIAFEGLNRSSRHKSGVAMRFPRISRLRWDKEPADADRLEALTAMLDA